jgi:hypothetical protein
MDSLERMEMTLTNDEQIQILNGKIESISFVISELQNGILLDPQDVEGKEPRQVVLNNFISEVDIYTQMIAELRG